MDGHTVVTTVRMSEAMAAELDVVARIDGVPVAEIIRRAIAAHLAERKATVEFQDRLRKRIAADRRILERLGGGSSG